MLRLYVGVLLPLLTGSCILPVGTAAPQPATTAGKGNFTFGVRAEAPTVDLVATAEDSESDYNITPFPVISPELGIGVHDIVDIEMSLDFTLYFVLPLPTGINAGARVQLVRNPTLALSVAARGGLAGVSSDVDREGSADTDDGDSIRAVYGYGGFSAQANPMGQIRPGIAANYWRARIHEDVDDQQAEFDANMGVITGTLDVALGSAHFGPFINLILIESDDYAGSEAVVTGGLMFYVRFGSNMPADGVPR